MPQSEVPAASPSFAPPRQVMLADGQFVELGKYSREELQRLQFEQEQRFAKAIMAFPARSRERALVVGQAYDTVCGILAAQRAAEGGCTMPLVMGFDQRYARLALQLMGRQIARGIGRPRLFEIGYGSGALLAEVRGHGYDVGGIEVSAAMREQAAAMIGDRYGRDLLLGDFRDIGPDDLPGRPTLIFWNDVLEHIGPDEAQEYVDHAHALLEPGGTLVTITPNWLLRPSDVTSVFRPPRTTACGLHLKEYRLKDVSQLLRRAGFMQIATPLLATRHSLVPCGGGGRVMKQFAEPILDRLPVKLGRLLCRGWAMSCTIAIKRRR